MRVKYFRAILYIAWALGWVLIGAQILALPLWLGDALGFTRWGYPWWTVLILLAGAALGYGVQRFAKFLLQDKDLSNMFGGR